MQASAKRAIVIDQNDSFRQALSAFLEKRGYDVFAASEPQLCPVLLKGDCPCPDEHLCAHVIFFDPDKPKDTGLEFLKNQKKHGCRVANIAVMSASWQASEVQCFQAFGCKIFHKPVKLGKLAEWLTSCEMQMEAGIRLSELPID